MNKHLFFIILFLSCGFCKGQNLVPNPSFEDTVKCPQTAFNLTDASFWLNFRESPDYFNNCSIVPDLGVPINGRGNQYAKDGNAYVAMAAYGKTTNNIREYAGIHLLQPLSIGTKYFVTFYISTGDTVSMNCGCNKMGAKFLTSPYSQSNPAPIDNNAHVYTDSIIYDMINWVKISGSFITDSAYEYLMLGNFFDDANTDTSHCSLITSSYAMYYLDAVCVSTDSLTCNSSVGINEVNNQEEVTLFPNPFTDNINVITKESGIIEVALFDITGRKILNQSFRNSTSVNTELLAKGIYLYEIRNKESVIKKGKIVKE